MSNENILYRDDIAEWVISKFENSIEYGGHTIIDEYDDDKVINETFKMNYKGLVLLTWFDQYKRLRIAIKNELTYQTLLRPPMVNSGLEKGLIGRLMALKKEKGLATNLEDLILKEFNKDLGVKD